MFNVGDIVTGVSKSRYSITNHNATLKVVAVIHENRMRVEVLDTVDNVCKQSISSCFNVDPSYFRYASLDLENV